MGYFLCTILYIVIFPFLYILIVSLTDLINLFDPICFELKKKNHIKYVEKLRDENRKKRKEREKNTNLFKNWYY